MIYLKTVKPINGEYYLKEINDRWVKLFPQIGETIIFYLKNKIYNGKVSNIIHDVNSSNTIFITILIDDVKEIIK